ncbi:MAG: Clp protease ClpP [Oscillospiraceae bacterium]|nr:Clp protease ClpP [Oscillospiraceae bacterium]
MPTIDIRGVIVPNNELFAYEWFGLDATAPKNVQQVLQEAKGDNVDVIINSNGGDVQAGVEIYTMLREYRGKVRIRIQSFAASAAAVISQAGESEMSPAGLFMIHNVSGGAKGDYRAMDHASQTLSTANHALAAAFAAKSGKTEKEVLELMDREAWFTAEQAVREGFVDRIMFTENSQNSNPVRLAASHGSGLLPQNVIEYARAHFNNRTGQHCDSAAAEAEYNYLLLKGETK